MITRIDILIRVVQCLSFSALVILERLTTSHALVMRHVYTKKIIHLGVFTPQLKLIFSAGVIVSLFILFIKCKRNIYLNLVVIFTLFYLWSPYTNNMMSYTYGVAVVLWVFVLEIILTIKNCFRKSKI